MKKLCLLLFLALLSIEAKSQELLNANRNQIKFYMATRGGILKLEKFGEDLINPQPHYILTYFFKKPTIEKNGVFITSYFLTKDDKCYEYMVNYSSDQFLKALTDKFDSRNSSLKRIGGMKWVDTLQHCEIGITKARAHSADGKILKTTVFMLDVRKTNS